MTQKLAFTLRCTILVVATSFISAGCSDKDSFVPGDGGQTQSDTSGGPCKPTGSVRCYGAEHQTCEGGKWVTSDHCAASEVCSTELGCVACIPGSGNTCDNGNVHACNADGTIGAQLQECLTEACVGGTCGQNKCSAASKLIYLVDQDNNLLSFDPRDDAHTFKRINRLTCPAKQSWPAWASDRRGTPFSMSVDRSDKAWVLYTSGELFWVNIANGACLETKFVPGYRGYQLFGMGFVTEGAGSSKEKLFIYGGAVGQLDNGILAAMSPGDLSLETRGSLNIKDKTPELTGTGNGKLFGFFPGAEAFVAEINKDNGLYINQWPIKMDLSKVAAWAFAHWGGRFYLFVADAGSTTRVLRLDPVTGNTEVVVAQSPFVVTGAGVSTCAPILL